MSEAAVASSGRPGSRPKLQQTALRATAHRTPTEERPASSKGAASQQERSGEVTHMTAGDSSEAEGSRHCAETSPKGRDNEGPTVLQYRRC